MDIENRVQNRTESVIMEDPSTINYSCRNSGIILMTALFSSTYIFSYSPYVTIILCFISIMFLIFSYSHFKGEIPISIDPYIVNVMLFSGYSLISSMWAWNKTYSIDAARVIILQMFLFLPLYFHYKKNYNILIITDSIVYSGLIVAAYTLYDQGVATIITSLLNGKRIYPSFENANTLGMLFATAIVIIIYYCFFFFNKRIKLLIFTLPLTVMVVACGSKKSILLIIICIPLLYAIRLIQDGKDIGITILKLVLGFFILLVALYFIMSLPALSAITNRFRLTIDYLFGDGIGDVSTRTRMRMTEIGLEQFKKTPICGIGIGNPRILSLQTIGEDMYLHNNYIELLAGGGILGVLAYLNIYIYLIYNYIKNRRNLDSFSIICIILILVSLVMDLARVSYRDKSTLFYFMLFYINVGRIKGKSKSKT